MITTTTYNSFLNTTTYGANVTTSTVTNGYVTPTTVPKDTVNENIFTAGFDRGDYSSPPNYPDKEFIPEVITPPPTVTITFTGGKEIVAEINANTYIVDEPFEVTARELTKVTITDGDNVQVLHNVIMQECASIDDRFWFGLHEMADFDLFKLKTRGDIDYIALMTDVDLEVGE